MRINRISIAIIFLNKFASLVSFGLVKLELDIIEYTTFYIVKCKPINGDRSGHEMPHVKREHPYVYVAGIHLPETNQTR